ncbi:metallophosphoesterase family protein [Chloroflexota bacterium]
MRIGLIADTHILQDGVEPPQQLTEIFEEVDLILHAGDLIVLSVLDWLEKIAPVLAVRGNGDSGLPPDPRLAEARALTVGGKRIGLCHYLDTRSDLQNAMERYFSGKVDVIVYGDTHVASIETHEGVLIINPGSPSIPRGLVGIPGTVGLLDIIDGTVEARIIQLG